MLNKIRIAVILAFLASFARAQMKLRVDISDAPRHILHASMTIPAKPGPMTLLYPEWIPGEHGPTGRVVDLVGLKISTGGKAIAWTRDAVNMYAFHVTVPAGASAIHNRSSRTMLARNPLRIQQRHRAGLRGD